ncbi:hypothetical protein [Larkinella rosea]|uniref:DUF4384 domain-containing protein n=1 Tax=Larkinella rosea TaxID=2025312 RepID=A0A3P1BTI6_9BACT|nr:hypothetical protein [Larkinella rosea]RRB03844.1 hypothetical protein EHT25_09910 [Larkinella rosea]
MNTIAKIISSLSLTALLWAMGCQTSVKPEPETNPTSSSTSSAPGFGTSKARPEGQPFVWPTGVNVLGKPKMEYECMANAVTQKRQYGSGGAVRFCLTLYNSNAQSVTIKFPPGIIWIAETSNDIEPAQNGIILKPVLISVPANSQITVMLDSFCINLDRDPTNYGDSYEPQPIVTQHSGMLELSQLVARKRINTEEREKTLPSADWATLQNAVHEVEKAGHVSDESRRELAALPE